MKTGQWIVGALLTIAATAALADERPTAEELLAGYQKSVEHLNRVGLECVEKKPERRAGENVIVKETGTRVIYRDEARWMVADIRRRTQSANGASHELATRQELVVGDQLISFNLIESRDGMPVPIDQGLQIVAWLERKMGRTTEGAEQGVANESEQMIGRMLGGVQTLFGRFSGDGEQPIWDVMRDSSALELLPETEVIGGVETSVVRSEGKFGTHMLWLDPKYGGLPRRIEITRKLGNLYNDNQLGSRIGQPQEPLRAGGKGPPPNQKPDLRESWLRIDDVRIEKKDGVFVMTAWNEDWKLTRGDGKTMGERVEFSVSSVNFKPETWPDSAFRPSMEVPNKTRVTARDGIRGTEYEWVGGKVQVRAGN
jgi:hypothetical protein